MAHSASTKNHEAVPPPSALREFDFDPRTRVLFGSGTIDRLGELAAEFGKTRVFLVTDHGLAQAGHEQRAVDALTSAGLDVTVYDDVHPNPTTEDVDRALEVARRSQVELIVGLGGGSSMDCAKGVNFLISNGGRMEDYWGIGKAIQPMLPMIAVPTTAGTGSEAQSFALIANPETHMKMACGDKKALCNIAILDPELTLTMPRPVTAVTGIDAISHAVETYVTTKRNAISQLFSRRAWGLLSQGLPRVLADPQDTEARGMMLLGAHFAGAAIENSMLGATHALANPLTAHFGLTHGIAIGIMLPHVIRYNASVVNELYGDLAEEAGLCPRHDPDAAERLADHIAKLVARLDCPTTLHECNVVPENLPQLTTEAAKQWTGQFNPRPVSETSLLEIYECAFSHDSV